MKPIPLHAEIETASEAMGILSASPKHPNAFGCKFVVEEKKDFLIVSFSRVGVIFPGTFFSVF